MSLFNSRHKRNLNKTSYLQIQQRTRNHTGCKPLRHKYYCLHLNRPTNNLMSKWSNALIRILKIQLLQKLPSIVRKKVYTHYFWLGKTSLSGIYRIQLVAFVEIFG